MIKELKNINLKKNGKRKKKLTRIVEGEDWETNNSGLLTRRKVFVILAYGIKSRRNIELINLLLEGENAFF